MRLLASCSSCPRPPTGYKAIDLIGVGATTYNSLIHPDDRDRVWNEVQEALGQGIPFRLTYRIRAADGREKWVWEQGVGVGSGAALALEGFITDITDRKDAEARLQAQNERFRRIIENTDAGYFRIGIDGCYEDVNPAWLRMHGFTRKEEAIGQHFSAVQVPEDVSKAAQLVEALVRGESVRSGEFSRLRRDGTIGYHSFSANPVLDGDRLIGIEGFLVDITDQKTAEQERRHTEQRYRSLFNSMHEGAALHKLIRSNGIPENYILLDVNRRYEDILGVKREHVVNKLATAVYGTEDAPYLKQYASVVETGSPFHFETYFPPLDKHFAISVAPMGDDLFATIFFDVTEQKKLQERYNLISGNAADVIWLWDLEVGRCVFVSPSVKHLRGFSPEEIMLQPMDQAMPPDTYRRILAETQRRKAAVESGDEGARIGTNEVEYLCKDGTTVHTETVTTLLLDERGTVRHVIGVTRDITERKRAEQAARDSAEHFRSLFSSMSEGVAYCEMLFDDDEPKDFEYRAVNAAFEQLTGLKNVVGKLVSEVIPGIRQSNPELFAIYGRVALTGKPDKFETYVKALGIWFSVSVYSPKVKHFVAVFDNITQRKRAEEALQEANAAVAKAERHYRLMFNSVSDAVFVFAIDGQFLEVNDSACRYLGYTREELLRMRFVDIVGPELNLDIPLLLQGLIAKGQLLYEGNDVAKDGRRIPVEVNTHLVELDGSQTLISSVRDITDRKEAEKKYRDIFEGALEGIYRTSTEGEKLTANPALARMLGYESSEEVASAINDSAHQVWLDPNERRRCAALLEEHGSVRGFECQFKRKDGTALWVSISGRKVCGADGRTLYYDGFIDDITERRNTDAEKAKLEEQLRQAQKIESIGRLAGGVAHDFNNLLTVINGYSDFLLERLNATDPLRSHAEEIRKAGERAASLTRQLLAFSRKQVIEPKVMDLNTTIRQSAPMLQRLIGEDIDLETYLDESLGQVFADPDQIYQVIMNLTVNARDAMPDGGTLDIETTNVELDEANTATIHDAVTPGRYVLMRVTDTGHGMDETIRLQIFEPFFTTKEVGKGTGLGLSTVYGIIRQNGGWIDVSSEVGVGTSFKVYLPRIDGSLAPEEQISAATEKGSETILLVEDQEGVRSFTKTVLERHGYQVIDASDAEEAIDAAGTYSGEIHLLLTDVVLPGMNGKELSEVLKAFRPNLKVLFTSGYTADAIGKHGVLGPGVAFLHKPFSPEELAAKVRKALESL